MRKILAGMMACGMLAIGAALPSFAKEVTISDISQN